MIELHLTIKADTVAGALAELHALGVGGPAASDVDAPAAATSDAVEPPPAKANGADAPKATRAKRAPAANEPAKAPAEAPPSRAQIVKELTELFMAGNPAIRKQITDFRDEQGVERLRELKDEALPAAAKLLVDLKLETADAP